MSEQSDQTLVDAVLAGDKAAFAELVRRYEPLARSAALAILRDRHLAQDALQETFLRAYANLGKLTDYSRFGAWVLTITRRQSFYLRDRQQRIGVALGPNEEPFAAENNDPLDEGSRELLEAVNRLPEHEQIVVVLHYFQSHKAESIGQITGQSTGTVTKQLSRAQRRLKQWLQETE
jgi:RNA polymerase sigma-70 factor (ECF subfamily)